MKFHTKNFHDDHAKVRRELYPDGTTKLVILNRYGQILCVPTVCLRDVNEQPEEGSVFIANYGGYEGVMHALQEEGVLGGTKRTVETGVHTRDPLLRRDVHECKLLTTDV